MPIIFKGLLEDVEPYEGKNGFGANVTVSSKVGKRVKRLSFITKDRAIAKILEDKLGEIVVLRIELNESKFGLRFGEVLDIADEYSQVMVD